MNNDTTTAAFETSVFIGGPLGVIRQILPGAICLSIPASNGCYIFDEAYAGDKVIWKWEETPSENTDEEQQPCQ